jgi:hypothetical protein
MRMRSALNVVAVVLGLTVWVGLGAEVALSQVVYLATGTVEPRNRLTKGQRLNFGETVSAGEDGLIVLEYRWKSDRDEFPCVGWVLISRRQTYRVSAEGKDGVCQLDDPEVVLRRVANGESLIGRVAFYQDAPYDVGGTPERIRRSQQTGVEFIRRLSTAAQSPRNVPGDLTGKWRGNDGGTYYIRHIGGHVWWYGESSDGGSSWSHVFIGQIEGRRINGQWVDVPRGRAGQSGRLTLEILGTQSLKALDRTGGFGGSEWSR